ncbi:MAG: aspartate--tRNA(Asn) ligase [Patescibacteria group bacterium]
MNRTLISDLQEKIGHSVIINGWITVRRDQGKMVFFDIRDRSGTVQGVVLPKSAAINVAKDVSIESAVALSGIVNKRPEKNVQVGKQNGDIELQIEEITVLNPAQTLPFELDAEVNLDTLLDNRPLTLRNQHNRDIFTLQAAILEAYRKALQERGFIEFQAPAIVGGDAEGGAAAFKVNYYYDTTAYLATSPQFYKEIMVNAFERSFTIAKIFRGEKHATPRHLSELTQMDFEMGFIKDHTDVMNVLHDVVTEVIAAVGKKHLDIFERFGVEVPEAPETFPTFTLTEAQDIIRKEFAREIEDTHDMSPEDERQICEYAKEKRHSDFVFITHYPTKQRAFYSYEEPGEEPFSRSFDLLFRGLEINSGSQRIHDYDQILERLRSRGLDPEKFSYYLQAHKYGIPPHGGCSTGLERFTMKMLDLKNIREATAFPRDMNRIDVRLSE